MAERHRTSGLRGGAADISSRGMLSERQQALADASYRRTQEALVEANKRAIGSGSRSSANGVERTSSKERAYGLGGPEHQHIRP